MEGSREGHRQRQIEPEAHNSAAARDERSMEQRSNTRRSSSRKRSSQQHAPPHPRPVRATTGENKEATLLKPYSNSPSQQPRESDATIGAASITHLLSPAAAGGREDNAEQPGQAQPYLERRQPFHPWEQTTVPRSGIGEEDDDMLEEENDRKIPARYYNPEDAGNRPGVMDSADKTRAFAASRRGGRTLTLPEEPSYFRRNEGRRALPAPAFSVQNPSVAETTNPPQFYYSEGALSRSAPPTFQMALPSTRAAQTIPKTKMLIRPPGSFIKQLQHTTTNSNPLYFGSSSAPSSLASVNEQQAGASVRAVDRTSASTATTNRKFSGGLDYQLRVNHPDEDPSPARGGRGGPFAELQQQYPTTDRSVGAPTGSGGGTGAMRGPKDVEGRSGSILLGRSPGTLPSARVARGGELDPSSMFFRSEFSKASGIHSSSAPTVLGVFFSTGDLGDVGRHAVAAALERPASQVGTVKVFSSDIASLQESKWKCGCTENHSFSEIDHSRLQLIKMNITVDNIAPHLQGVDAVISCLGNRKPFHPDSIAKEGTERILEAMSLAGVNRLVMLSSVGIADDWPPMEWSSEGARLQGFFRTICWIQYQDLSGAELAVRQARQATSGDFLIVRPVILGETTRPAGEWFIQEKKHSGKNPDIFISKMDCARFMVQEAINYTCDRQAVVLGGIPREDSHEG